MAHGTTAWTAATAPPKFGAWLRAIGTRLVLDDLVSDAGATWRSSTQLTDPYLHQPGAFAMRAAPSRVVFQNLGMRSGLLP